MYKSKPQVVVSMTSFPAAIEFAVTAMKSILEGAVLPDKAVLYLTLAQFGENGIPKELTELAQENPIFEIRDYPTDIRSYRKLVPALTDFPDAVIVTVDDDVKYGKTMLQRLLELHKETPDAIVCHRAKKVMLDRPYRKWEKYRWYHFMFKKDYSSYLNIQTGVGGVLYPPHSLKKEMIDVELFTKLAPTADDIWFWASAVANRRKIRPVPFGQNKPKGLGKPKSIALKTINFKSGVDRNSAAINAVLENYPEIKNIVKEGN